MTFRCLNFHSPPPPVPARKKYIDRKNIRIHELGSNSKRAIKSKQKLFVLKISENQKSDFQQKESKKVKQEPDPLQNTMNGFTRWGAKI